MTPIQSKIAELEDIKAKRAFLSEISVGLRHLITAGKFDHINEAIAEEVYATEGHTTLKTFEEWKREGKRVRKGEKALFVWGAPKYRETKDESGESAEKFFPLCYLFSNLQVQ